MVMIIVFKNLALLCTFSVTAEKGTSFCHYDCHAWVLIGFSHAHAQMHSLAKSPSSFSHQNPVYLHFAGHAQGRLALS